MKNGNQEVENNVIRVSEAGQALMNILQAVETVSQQVKEIAAATQQMNTASDELVRAMDSVSLVVDENTAATAQMSAGSSEVAQAIENIASVSEENSAAAEEVSAAVEEMSAQVEEVTASAQSLAELAQTLQQIVAQFKLVETSNAVNQTRNGPNIPARTPTREIIWNKSMSTGLLELDEQHKQLIHQLNELMKAMKQRRGRAEIEGIMDFLEGYVRVHFSDEELSMEKHHCPFAEANRRAHASFSESFSRLRAQFQEEGASAALAIAIQRDLLDWLVNHICQLDASLHPYVQTARTYQEMGMTGENSHRSKI
jgi:hemerythrin-like metal-binding protein